MDLYTSEGWVNAACLIDSPADFVIAIGGRGIGKTYGVLSLLLDLKEPFLYMRRTQTQIDETCIPSLNPFNKVASDKGLTVTAKKIGKHTSGFFLGEDPEPFCIGIALSTISSIRGISAERFKYLVFDEIIPESTERPIKGEESAFLNAIETLNRNRELEGSPALKVIMLSNSNTLNSKILSAMGLLMPLENAIRSGAASFFFSNNHVQVIRYIDSPISERKAKTALYRASANEDFSDMAINNKFSRSDFEYVKSKPLIEYVPLVSVGDITIYKHKSRQEYYVIMGVKCDNKFSALPIDLKAFRRQYFFIYGAMLRRAVFFQSALVKIKFEEVFDNG